MNLSFKDIKFIIEAIDRLIEKYQERLNEIEDTNEDEACDLGNDTMFLESLRRKLANSLNNSTNTSALVGNEVVQPSLNAMPEKPRS
ncbi:MAG: hypothetical protein ACYTXC_16405 [Nostoc sp.]